MVTVRDHKFGTFLTGKNRSKSLDCNRQTLKLKLSFSRIFIYLFLRKRFASRSQRVFQMQLLSLEVEVWRQIP